MSKYTLSSSYPLSHEETVRWGRESKYFQFHPPLLNAPDGTSAANGWGIHPRFLPPNDAIEYVIAIFKRDVAGVSQEEKLRPEYKWSIISVCMAHFLWFRTSDGAEWLLRFFGVEEIDPFFSGYAYMYVSRENDSKQKQYVHLEKDGEVELRIFHRTERVLDTPVGEDNDEPIDHMQMIMKEARDPNAIDNIAEPSSDMYSWVSEQIRDWFIEVNPDKHWPSDKPNRISGYQWAKTLERKKGQLFYEAIDNVELHRSRAYRLKDSRGSILWCGGKDIRAVPLQDHFKEKQYSSHQIDNMFRCSDCNNIRPCMPASGDYKLCSACFGSVIQKDERKALDLCLMKECSKCDDHFESKSDLISLKNSLNREMHFPVHR